MAEEKCCDKNCMYYYTHYILCHTGEYKHLYEGHCAHPKISEQTKRKRMASGLPCPQWEPRRALAPKQRLRAQILLGKMCRQLEEIVRMLESAEEAEGRQDQK